MKILRSNWVLLLGLVLGQLTFGAQNLYAQQAAPTETTTEATEAAAAAAAPAPVEPTAPEESSAAPTAPVAPAAPAAPAIAQLNEVSPPPEGMGQVVFFRPSRLTGMAVSFSVREGDNGIGKLTNGTYFVHVSEPGTKEYNISSEVRDTLRMEIEAGETYYVIQSIGMGVMIARPNLTPSSEAAFQERKLNITRARATDRHSN